MSIHQFSDYRSFLTSHFRLQPGGGRGQMQKLALALGVHSTFVSLVFKNKRDFSAEQGLMISDYLKLTEKESEYFLNMIHLARAGTHLLQQFYRKKILQAQEAAKGLETRFEHDRMLEAEERQVFYSSWHYSAIRIYTSTKKHGCTVEEICENFKISRRVVVEALDFLTKTNLVVEKKGRFQVGAQRTYLEKGHPLLKCHHTNWRQKALTQFEEISNEEMMFTTTMSLSREDFQSLREHIAQLVKKASDIMKETSPEDVACLNIDFFWVK